MQCDKCRRDAVIFQRYSGLHLCREHFIADFESKAKRAIRSGGGLRRGDHIAIAGYGGYKSGALMHFLAMLTKKRRDITLSAIIAGKETPGSGLAGIREVQASLGITCILAPGAGEDRISDGTMPAGTGITGSFPGSLWESLLEPIACAHGVTKIACGTGLDDEALSVLETILKGEPLRLLRTEPDPGGRTPRIRPFLHIPNREIALYARLTFGWQGAVCSRHSRDPFSEDVKKMLDEHAGRHPSAPHALANLGERLAGVGILQNLKDPPGGSPGDGCSRSVCISHPDSMTGIP